MSPSPPLAPAPRPAAHAPHAIVLELLGLGFSYAEALALPYEDVLCYLHLASTRRQLAQLDAEAARLSSLPLADPHAVQRELRKVELRAKGIVASCQ